MLRDFFLEVTVRRRNHADVDANVCRAAHALEALLFEKPQELRLKPRRHLADFVEEHRPAIRRLEQALLLQPASVNAPRSWPNSSLSSNCSGSAEHVMFMNGLEARSLE